MSYENKLVWITGASSGIGEALTYAFAQAGARLILSARNRETLERVKAACPYPDRVTVVPLDLAAYETIPDVAGRIEQELGSIDYLINNGGISQRSLVLDTQMVVYRKLMDVNYFGSIALTKAVLPGMLHKGQGHIVTVSSLTGEFSTPLRSGYAAAKHALHGFFKALRLETMNSGVAVSLICPGFIRTQVSVNALTADGSPQNSMDDNQERGMKPEELARRILRDLPKQRRTYYYGGKEILGIYLNRWFPNFFERLLLRSKTAG